MAILEEFRTFIARGNVLDLAVGVIIGGAFGKIVTSLTESVIMPVVSARRRMLPMFGSETMASRSSSLPADLPLRIRRQRGVVMRYFQVRAAQASNALFVRSECHADVIQLPENGRP